MLNDLSIQIIDCFFSIFTQFNSYLPILSRQESVVRPACNRVAVATWASKMKRQEEGRWG